MHISLETLRGLATPFPARIADRIRRGRIREAVDLTAEMVESRVLLHDFFADSCTVLWSWIGERLGEDSIEPMFRFIFAHAARRQFFDAARAQVLPHLTVSLLAKSWRAHSCFGAGEHPGAFSITEDDQKFTFHLHPCGSGLRLWQKGWYRPGKGGRLSAAARPWTYRRKGFPYYCIHCPFLNEILPWESDYGALMWPVDPPEDASDTCAWHIYKDPNRIPEKYYERLGLVKKPVPVGPYPPRRRYFDEKTLDLMARPVTDRIQEALRTGNRQTAIRLCRGVADEFLVLHDLYVNMLAATFDFIAEGAGEAGLGDSLERQYERCVEKQVKGHAASLDTAGKTAFLATRIFGADTCNQTGYHPGRFRIEETASQIVFRLAPCGSGGRLWRSGAYGPMPRIRRLQENLENTAATYAAHALRIPEPLIRFFFPLMVTHFTQRKPFGLKRTASAHPWSFDRPGIPYFCCQCGKIQEKLGGEGLVVQPPAKRRDACVWRLKK